MRKTAIEKLISEKTRSAGFEIRLHSALYDKSTKKLEIEFLLNCTVTDKLRKMLNEIVYEAFFEDEEHSDKSTEKIIIKYTKSYIDEEFLRDKIYKYFENNHNFLKLALKKNDIVFDVEFDAEKVSICFSGTIGFCDYIERGVKGGLLNYLNRSFVNDFTILVSPNVDDKDDVEVDEDNEQNYSAIRELPVSNVHFFVGSPIAYKPAYIVDIDVKCDICVVAGKVTDIVRRARKPKPQRGGKLSNDRFYTFKLTDVSGSISCVFFPTKGANKDMDNFEKNFDGREIMVQGSVGIDTFKKDFSLMVKKIATCEIDKNAKKPESVSKSVPFYYTIVTPEKCSDAEQLQIGEKVDAVKINPNLIGKSFVALDFETTSIDVSTLKVTEIGAYKVVDGLITEKFSSLFDPEIPLTQKVTDITGLTDEMLKGKPLFSDAVGDFYKFSKGCILAAHNGISFDFKIIQRFGKQQGYVFDNEVVDTLHLAQKKLKLAKNTASHVAEHFHIENKNAHRALNDAYVVARFLQLLY